MSNYTQTTFFAPKDVLPSGNPNKLILGAQVDPELAAIAVAIATKFDAPTVAANPVLFATGTAPLPSITFTGGTNNNTGLYLAASNSLGFSANGVSAGVIATSGQWQIPKATSADAFKLSGNSGHTTFLNNVMDGPLLLSASSSTNDYTTINFTDITGTTRKASIGALYTGSGSTLTLGVSNNYVNGITHAGLVLGFNGSANFSIQGYGPTAAAGVDMTPDAGTFSMSFTGSSMTSATARWSRMGNLVVLTFPTSSGTGSTTAFTATGIPAAIQPANAQRVAAPAFAVTNGGTLGVADFEIGVSGSTATFLASGNAAGWTASGTRAISTAFQIAYVIN